MRRVLSAGLFVPALIMTACGDPAEPPRPASLAIVSGAGQSAAVTTTLSQPLVVEVRDAGDRPVRGVRVTWAVTAGGGSVSSASTSTSSDGRAQTHWTLGTAAGEQRITATVDGLAPVSVLATGQAGEPTRIEVVSGSDQSGRVGTELPLPLIARVSDSHGNPVSGASVTFAATVGGYGDPGGLHTGPDGLAQTIWHLGVEAGEQTMNATVYSTLAQTTFSATATLPPMPVTLENGVPVAGLAGEQGDESLYVISIGYVSGRLRVTLSGGEGDADLYVGNGWPTTSSYTCRSASDTSNEECLIHSPDVAHWFILVHARTSYSGVTLEASYDVGGSLDVDVSGLPPGVPAGITITGPDSYSRTLDGSMLVQGLTPGQYDVSAAPTVDSDVVYNAEPASQTVAVEAREIARASVRYAPEAGSLNLDIAGLHITQSVQRAAGGVRLIAGRDGLLRVYVRANAVNSATPAVRVRIHHDGSLVDERVIAAPGSDVPITIDDAILNTTWNVLLPGALIQPGMSITAELDPENEIEERDETDNAYPVDGSPLSLTVRTVLSHQARFVPVLQVPNGLQGDVSAANLESYTSKAAAMFPVPSVDADVRVPYSFSGELSMQYDSVWQRLLSEMLALRDAEASGRYYYGVVRPAYNNGGTGIGYIGLPASIGVDWSNTRAETVAHEWGHNFGRLHVACGDPSNPDPDYPYTIRPGDIGHHGWDGRAYALRPRHYHQDIMSYCQPTWISDYTYEGIMHFRGPAAGAAEPALLVWGRITQDDVVLEPAFLVNAIPSLPQRNGAYRLTGTDAGGAQVLDIAFEGAAIDHLPDARHFSFAIPLRMLGGHDIAELRLSGPAGAAVRRQGVGADPGDITFTRERGDTVRVRWNAAAAPAVLVRDPRTGAVLTIARDGDARIVTRATELEVNMSNGVRSGVRRMAVER